MLHLTPVTKLKLRLIAGFALALLGVLLASRFVLVFVTARSYFQDLGAGQFLLGLLNGLRFDAATLGLFFLPAQLFLLLPSGSKAYLKFFFALDLLLALLLTFFISGDLIFFETFTKHLTVEAPTALANLDFLIPYVLREYWYILLLGALAFAGALRLGFRYIDRQAGAAAPNWRESLCLALALAALAFVGIRGKLTYRGKFLQAVDANAFGNRQMADLSLNGVFSVYEAERLFGDKKLLLDEKTAVANAAAWVMTRNELPSGAGYPFMRKRAKSSLKLSNPNIVVIFLESWDRHVMETAAGRAAAPNFSKLWDNGLRFPDFYAEGTRSLLGFTGALFSIPYVPGLPHINRGLETQSFPRLGKYFRRLGYKTFFLQADKRRSERADELAAYMDFDAFYGAEDNPFIKDYLPLYKKNDYEAYQFLFDKLDAAGDKFMSFFYSASIHYPYDEKLPDKYRLTPGSTEQERYLNLVHYSDAGLGAFMEKASKRPWFANTVFLVLPDHRAPLREKPWAEKDAVDAVYSSFLLVYAPRLFKPAVNPAYASQRDLLPTLLDLAGSREAYASAGSSVFDPARRDKVILFGEDGETYIAGPGLRRQLKLDGLKPAKGLDPVELAALSLSEALYRTLKEDKWMKPQ